MREAIRIILLGVCVVGFYSCKEKTENKTTNQSKYDYLINMDPDSLSYQELYNRTLTLWDVSYQELDINTTYGKAHVITAGPEDAYPLVLLHGMNSSSTMWYPNISALSKHNRVYAIDFILEPNKSELKGEMSEIPQVMDWYFEVIDHLKLKKFNIAGASKGGWIAVNLALDKPERINKMFLLSPAQTFIWIRPSKKIIESLSFTLDPDREDLRGALESMSNHVDNIDQLYIDQYYRAVEKAETDKFMTKVRPYSENELKSLSMPVMVLIGEDDIVNNSKSLELAKELIPNVKTETIKDAGHFVSMDQSKKVNKMMVDFLKKD